MNWQRLESATIDPQLTEGLEGRVADPAWFLARQWQVGEFRGEDAANPVLIQLAARSVRVDRVVLPGGGLAELDAATPLEPLVEREPIRRGPSGGRVAAELGRILLTALARTRAGAAGSDSLRSRYPLVLGADDGLDPVGRRRLQVLARRSIDGVALAADLEADAGLLDRLLDEWGAAGRARERLAELVRHWQVETAAAFSDPPAAPAWDPTRLEYRFELRATTEGADIRLVADGYPGGRLEWHSFDRADSPAPTAPESTVVTRRIEVLPVPLRFRGMPAVRFWEFEQGDVSFGAIDAGPEDLARVAVADYALVYGHDWYVLPLQVPAATLTTVTSVRVLDDFQSVLTDIPPAAVVDGGNGARAFRFFELTGDPAPPRGVAPALFLPPALETADAGRPLEDVRLVRDEAGNLAWAVEHRIESAAGRPVDLAARSPHPPSQPPEAGDDWRFTLSTAVPDHWVPLVPVRFGADGGIRLQRGRVPVPGGASRGARGRILEPERRLLLHEEEVLRTGVRVVRRFQSARDPSGRLHTWVGRRKGPGRGQGSSGLEFDVLEPD